MTEEKLYSYIIYETMVGSLSTVRCCIAFECASQMSSKQFPIHSSGLPLGSLHLFLELLPTLLLKYACGVIRSYTFFYCYQS